jgi:ATP-dependent helicase/nuclease subunit A
MKSTMTPDQEAAIRAVDGDLAISAGAGSGKTTVLARRFAWAMRADADSDWEPADIGSILTITFTNKAAGEIGERVRRTVNREISIQEGRRIGEAWISTIHTFCGRLIRRHLLESGVDPRFSQADDVAASLLKAEAFESAQTLYGRHPATRLLEAGSVNAIGANIVSAYDNIRAMGLDPVDAVVPDGRLSSRRSNSTRSGWPRSSLASLRLQADRTIVRRALDEWAARLGACSLGDDDACATLMYLEADYGVDRLQGSAAAANQALRAAMIALCSAASAAVESGLIEGYQGLIVAFARENAELKRNRAVLDFDDLQERAVELLRENPGLAERYRQHFTLLMVDEFKTRTSCRYECSSPCAATICASWRRAAIDLRVPIAPTSKSSNACAARSAASEARDEFPLASRILGS